MKKEENIIFNWYEKMREDKPELKKEFISEGSLLYWLAEKQIINFAHSSLPLKDKYKKGFDEWFKNESIETDGKDIFINDITLHKNDTLIDVYNSVKDNL